MSDVLDRGLTVTELASMDQAIDVTPHTTTAFVGRALRGPLNTPVSVDSFADFRRRFGDIWSRSSLGPAVQQFFEHGGTELVIVRVANSARAALLCLPADGSALVLRAVEPGSTEILRAAVDYDGIEGDDDQRFNLTLQRMDPDTGMILDQEMFRRVSHVQGADRFVADVLLTSQMVRAEHPFPTHRPEVTMGVHHPFDSAYIELTQRGSDGHELTDYDVIGSRFNETGLFALRQLDTLDIVYVPPPGKTTDLGPASLLAAEVFCRERGAMLIIDPPRSWTNPGEAVSGIRSLGLASANVVGYFPRMKRRDDADGEPRAVGGALAGLLCKLDRRFGPWTSLGDAGLGFLRNWRVVDELSEHDARQLRREGLNTIGLPERGVSPLVGGITLSRGLELDRKLASLPVRRLCLQVVATIDKATRWAVFHATDDAVPGRIESQLTAYLAALSNVGALASDQFIARCERQAASLEIGHPQDLVIRFGFVPSGCEESIAFTLHQSTAGCRVASARFTPLVEDCA